MPVELDRAHVRARVGQRDGERTDARARPRRPGRPAAAPASRTMRARGVLVGEEVLAERLRRPDAVARRAARGSRSASPFDAEDARRVRARDLGDLARARRRARAASAAPTATTSAGSFGLPRYGSGVRNGESVSTRMRSAGAMRAASRSVVGVLERDDAAERQVAAARRARARASSGPPVKQWKIVRSGTPSSSSTRNVSSHASREWITSGLPVCFASRIWNRNAVSCSSRGECS